MALFKKKAKPTPPPLVCPICEQTLTGSKQEQGWHWLEHLDQIPAGQGAASGQYTWTCECGHSQMKWPGRSAAETALKYHVHRAHGVLAASDIELEVFDRDPNYRYMRGRLQ